MSGRNKVGEARSHTEKGRNILEAAKEKGEQALTEARELSKIACELRSIAQDSDLAQVAEIAAQATREEVQSFMKNEVGSEIEKGGEELETSDKITEEQLSINEQIKISLETMDNVSKFGGAAREKGKTEIERSSTEFQGISQQNTELKHNTESDYQRQCTEADSLSF